MSNGVKKICRYLNITYVITGVLSLLVFLFLLPSIQSVETDKFDVTRWLDADIFIINNIFIPLFFITVIAIIAEFIIKKNSENK